MRGNPNYVSWSRDGESLVLTGRSGQQKWLKRLNLIGESELLWYSDKFATYAPRQSPDGRFIALLGTEMEGDAWMIEDF